MKNLSLFEIILIALAVLIAAAGGGAWYYFSSELQTLHDNDLQQAEQQFVNDTQKPAFLPVQSNIKTLQENIDVLNGYLAPLEKAKLKPEGNLLSSIQNIDTASWKSDLDSRINKLNVSAKSHHVQVPGKFYYGFSRFLNQNPDDAKTGVLDKQLAGIEELANILIQNEVKGIDSIRRSYEEDDGGGAEGRAGGNSDKDYLPARATSVQDGLYTSYPLEVSFETTTSSLRQIINNLQASPYLFIIRRIEIHNSRLDSPRVSDLDHLAGTSPGDSNGGGAAPPQFPSGSNPSQPIPVVKGPQFLFGAETLQVDLRLDFVEWKGLPPAPAKPAPPTTAPKGTK